MYSDSLGGGKCKVPSKSFFVEICGEVHYFIQGLYRVILTPDGAKFIAILTPDGDVYMFYYAALCILSIHVKLRIRGDCCLWSLL